MNVTRTRLIGPALAGALTLFVFWPCVRNGFVHWDDTVYLDALVARPSLRWVFTQSQTISGYYHPLTWLSLWLDYEVWGLRPAPFHATNLLLHVLNTMMVVVLADRLLRSVAERECVTLALAVGIAFGIHPLQVESVAWVAERKNVLCGFFSLATLYAHVRGWRWATSVLFVAALLSKPMAIVLPLVMIVLDWYPLRRAPAWKERWPMLVLSAATAASTWFLQLRQGALTEFAHLSVYERVLAAGRSFVFYAWKLVWPAWLSPFYPMGYGVPLVICAVAAVLAFVCVRWRPPLGAAVAAYAVFLAPVSGVIPLSDYAVADRYAYLAMVPLLVAMAGGMVWLWRRFAGAGRLALVGLVACNFVFWGFQTRAQIGVWHNDETLWSAVLERFPEDSRARGDMAMALARQGRFEEALPLAQAVARAKPHYWMARTTLGFAYLGAKQYEEAERELQIAVALNPNSAVAQYDLACACSRLGKLAESAHALREAVRLDAQYAQVARNDPDLEALKSHPDYKGLFGF